MLHTLLEAVAFCVAGPVIGLCVWFCVGAIAYIFGDPDRESWAYVILGFGAVLGLAVTLMGIIKGLFIFMGALK